MIDQKQVLQCEKRAVPCALAARLHTLSFRKYYSEYLVNVKHSKTALQLLGGPPSSLQASRVRTSTRDTETQEVTGLCGEVKWGRYI